MKKQACNTFDRWPEYKEYVQKFNEPLLDTRRIILMEATLEGYLDWLHLPE